MRIKTAAIKPKFGKWYLCKDVLPNFEEWVLTRSGTLGGIWYSRRKEGFPDGKQLCGCYDDDIEMSWYWEHPLFLDSNLIARYSPPDSVTHWMPLPTGDEPVEKINN